MGDSGRSMNVLKKILNSNKIEIKDFETPAELVEKYFRPASTSASKKKQKPGRPKVADNLKARNFTLCLAPNYLDFLDRLEVKDKKIQGRGRKVRFIIDQFIELGHRQEKQLSLLREALANVEQVLKGFSAQVKKGQKLELTSKEKAEISRVVNQVHLLIKVLAITPKSLHRLLSRSDWSLCSFCLDWLRKNGSAK